MEAVARIVTQDGPEFYIKEGINEVMLGREKVVSDHYFQIGENNTISKKHARIFWDHNVQRWKIQNLSKNKVSGQFRP